MERENNRGRSGRNGWVNVEKICQIIRRNMIVKRRLEYRSSFEVDLPETELVFSLIVFRCVRER